MKFCFDLKTIHRKAQSRPKGYFEAMLNAGTPNGDMLCFTPDALSIIKRQFAPAGLGDYIAMLAKPIARKIDAVLGTDLENCEGCEKRQATLNETFPLTSRQK